MDDFFLDLLADPLTGQPFFFDPDKNIIYNEAGSRYEVINGIPVLLTAKPSAIQKDELHRTFNSEFHYIEHYRQDAITFDYFAQHESAVTRNEIKRLEETIASRVPANAQIILDIGCGNGWVAKKFTPGRKVISTDIAITNVEKAKQTNGNKDHYGLVADAFNLPLKKDSVDCIIAAEVMEHVADPKLFIQKLTAVLKPGGKLIITTPFNEKIEYYLCVHCNKPTPKNAHLHSFNLDNIKAILPSGSKASTFHNKYMLKTRSYLLTQFLPLSIWKQIDDFANKIAGGATRLMIEYIK